MKKTILAIALLFVLLDSMATRIEYGNNVSITKPEYGDLYIAGGSVNINAPIYGDLIIAGGTVVINDSVMNDILLAAGKVTFNGYVSDDIRCAGGELNITRNVAGDLVCVGGTITISPGVSVGNLFISGGNLRIDGTVNGELKGASGKLILNGNVLKGVDCRGGDLVINGSIAGKSVLAAPDIILGTNASFAGDVLYWNKKGSLDFKQSIKNGKAIYEPSLRMENNRWYYLGAATVLGLLWYLGTALLMIMFLQYLFSTTIKKAADNAFEESLKSLGYGLLYFIGVPVVAVIAFVTVIGVPIGFMLLFGYIFSIVLATVISSVLASNWLNNRNNYQWSYWKLVFAALGLFMLFKLISLLPFAGWLIMFVVSCIAFGAILLSIKLKRSVQ